MNASSLKSWRENLNISQSTLANEIGVSRTTIQNWEIGNTPIPFYLSYCLNEINRSIRREDLEIGPVTLVYFNKPLFKNLYGEIRHAKLRRELYHNAKDALKRCINLYKDKPDKFNDYFILLKDGNRLWDTKELKEYLEKI